MKASCSEIQVLGNEVCFVFTVNSVTAHKHQQLHKSRNTLETTRTVFICNVLKHHLLSASILYSYWQSDMPSRLLLLHYGVWKWAAEPPWDQLEVACGFVVGLFLGLFLALALAFIQTENSGAFTSTVVWLFSLAAPNSGFLQEKGGHFLWPFTSGTNTCFLLPVIASLCRKSAVNVRKALNLAHVVSDDEGAGDLRNWQERNISSSARKTESNSNKSVMKVWCQISFRFITTSDLFQTVTLRIEKYRL